MLICALLIKMLRRGIPERLKECDEPPRVLIVTCATAEDTTRLPEQLGDWARRGGTGDDFIVLTDAAASAVPSE